MNTDFLQTERKALGPINQMQEGEIEPRMNTNAHEFERRGNTRAAARQVVKTYSLSQ